MKVLLTGGSGIVGHYVIDELYRHGYEVVNADLVRFGNLGHSGTAGASQSTAIRLRATWPQLPAFYEVDVTNYGQVISSMDGCEAVIALAACPSAEYYTEEFVFATNTVSMWNVCRAAEQLGIRRVILGSSYNAIGAMGTAARWTPKEVKPPPYFPIDDKQGTRSEDPYSVAKWVGEQVADAFARRNPEQQIASMRFNGMWDDERLREIAADPVSDPWTRCQGFWTSLTPPTKTPKKPDSACPACRGVPPHAPKYRPRVMQRSHHAPPDITGPVAGLMCSSSQYRSSPWSIWPPATFSMVAISSSDETRISMPFISMRANALSAAVLLFVS